MILITKYLQQPPIPNTAKSFLEMHQFGAFTITDAEEMKFFGRMIQAFLFGPGQAITPSTTEEPSAKHLPVRPPAKDKPAWARTPMHQKLRPYKPLEDPSKTHRAAP